MNPGTVALTVTVVIVAAGAALREAEGEALAATDGASVGTGVATIWAWRRSSLLSLISK